jgi:uncharacterized protein YceK
MKKIILVVLIGFTLTGCRTTNTSDISGHSEMNQRMNAEEEYDGWRLILIRF